MDERFKKVLTDPRFIKPRKDATKVKLDERFAHMLKSEEFGTLGGIDSRGRKREASLTSDLKQFYAIEDSESEPEQRPDFARGEILAESSEEEFSEEEEPEVDSGPWADEDIPRGDETARFAVLNMSWDHVKAKHLFKIFDGFKPKGGIVKSVKIYVSDFGKERMARENLHGPPQAVFQTGDSDTEDGVNNDDGKDFNMVALRKYEVEKLRYYYAVVECDSVGTASAIYKTCDGTEFESSANFFDLRFIPEDMEFDDEPVDSALEAPAAFEPVEFVNQALQHSNVKLTWDAEDPERVKTTKRKFSKQDIKDMDFKSYLASDSEEEVDEELAAKYKTLIAGSEDESEEEGMEITFTPGLSEKAEQLLKKKEDESLRKNESVFEAERRKIRERRQKKKELESKEIAKEENESSDEERDDMDDPFFQQDFGSEFEEEKENTVSEKEKKKKKSKEERDQQRKAKAELELLFMDEDKADDGHFHAKDILKKEKAAKNKKKQKKLQKMNLDTQEDYKMDLQDPRFKALVDDHEFFIDPNSSNFHNTNAMREILKLKRNKRADPKKSQWKIEPNGNGVKKDVELDSLLASVKRKNQQLKEGKNKKRKSIN